MFERTRFERFTLFFQSFIYTLLGLLKLRLGILELCLCQRCTEKREKFGVIFEDVIHFHPLGSHRCTAKNPGFIYPRLGCLSFNAAICTLIIPCWIRCCNYVITQYKINWISMQCVIKFICSLQVGTICLQHSHDDVIG